LIKVISCYKFEDNAVQGSIKIALKYDIQRVSNKDIQRISKPGLRKYSSSSSIPRILNGLGIAIVSHQRFDDWKKSQTIKCGEVICYV
jgi:small subunit ribosomal protein S8